MGRLVDRPVAVTPWGLRGEIAPALGADLE
jgi:hypothetical protein